MIEIAITSDAPHFSQENLIFGRHYVIEFEWIEREGYWVMHLYDASENPIALGLKLTPSWPIFIDKEADIAFLLLAKKQNAQLTRSSLHADFSLVAYEIV